MSTTRTPRKDGAVTRDRYARDLADNMLLYADHYIELRIEDPDSEWWGSECFLWWSAIVDAFCDWKLHHRSPALDEQFEKISNALFNDPDYAINHYISGGLGGVEYCCRPFVEPPSEEEV